MEHKRLWIIEALIHRTRDFPDEAVNELLRAMDVIEKKFNLLRPLTEYERQAIEEGLASLEAGRGVSHEEVMARFADRLKDFDADAAGREALIDATARLQRRPGEDQGAIADVIFALLDEPRFDIPPHTADPAR